MPFVRISMAKGKTGVFKKSVSQAVHAALVNCFEIPSDDLFQIIAEYDEENVIYPSSYMGIEHTSDILYIVITAKGGRTVDMKKSLYKMIATNIHGSTGHDTQDIIITLVENSEENWSFGRGEAQLIS